MVQDTRRVQTAVLGSPTSDYPLSLPTDRKEAELYLKRYKGKRFYCGEHLGGCGWELMDKLYRDRVCHFAHHPDPKGIAPQCERRYFGADSADHLYIHRGLTSGLGRSAVSQPFRGTMAEGQCTALLVNPARSRSAIKVQFVNLPSDAWTTEDEELRARLGRVDWMLGARASVTAKYLVDRDGYALRVRCEQEGTARVVKVGTETRDGDLEWCALNDCEISGQGIVTPLLRKRRRIAKPPAAPAVRLPRFPLAVEDIVIYPQERVTRPIGGPGIPEGSYVAAADICIGEGDRLHARIMVPDHLDLAVDEPYSLVEPASVNALISPGNATPVWTVFSAGVRRIRTSQPPSVQVPQKPTPEPAAPAQEPGTFRKKAVSSPGQSEALVRHKLTSLIRDMRDARKIGDHGRLLQTLRANEELLKALTRPHFNKEREAIQELSRWATAKDEAHARNEREVRERSAALIDQIDRAKAAGNLEEAQSAVDDLRKTLVRVSLSNPKFTTEARSLHDRESWLVRAQSERDRAARARTQEALAESIRSKQHSRLSEVLDRLQKAEIAGETAEVRKLHKEGRSLLNKLGNHATSYEKRHLDLTAQWLAAGRADRESGAETSATTLELSVRSTPRDVADRISAVLKRTARDQVAINLEDLAGEVAADRVLCAKLLIEVDEPVRDSGPLLSALVTSPDGSVRGEFREILTGLGYEVPKTDRALQLVWQREVERTHACYAEPPREMPTSLVPRKMEPA
ncbi:hypothetical protein [Microtetraspora niveoalba]|uniref:hypothetical protein n=1 Tax=Microtetraspora niveoalba TaxID=46175 RepID=UPI00082B12F5|nr:hypothetical protein [Microtetraspora niveoalba]